MKNKIFYLCLLTFIFTSFIAEAQREVLYKQIDTTKLYMEVYQPAKFDSNQQYPAMVFFFGGGWNGGTRKQFLHHAMYFSERGIVCFLADYRVKNKHLTTPFEALKDAKSAIRFIRKNAKELCINPDAIIASGGSAGGHLAAATALVDGFNDLSDDISISCKPNALVLYNAVIDNGPGGYGYNRIKDAYKDFSPLHNIMKGAPPTILFLGSKDNLIPIDTYKYYKIVMEKVKSRCELKIYEGGKHGFFNYNEKNLSFYKSTVRETDTFLQSEGYLQKKPSVEIK